MIRSYVLNGLVIALGVALVTAAVAGGVELARHRSYLPGWLFLCGLAALGSWCAIGCGRNVAQRLFKNEPRVESSRASWPEKLAGVIALWVAVSVPVVFILLARGWEGPGILGASVLGISFLAGVVAAAAAALILPLARCWKNADRK